MPFQFAKKFILNISFVCAIYSFSRNITNSLLEPVSGELNFASDLMNNLPRQCQNVLLKPSSVLFYLFFFCRLFLACALCVFICLSLDHKARRRGCMAFLFFAHLNFVIYNSLKGHGAKIQ